MVHVHGLEDLNIVMMVLLPKFIYSKYSPHQNPHWLLAEVYRLTLKCIYGTLKIPKITSSNLEKENNVRRLTWFQKLLQI